MKIVKVGFLGFGTVGKGAYELLHKNGDLIERRIGVGIEVSKVFVRKPENYEDYRKMPCTVFTSRVEDILEDPSIDVVVEVMGGTTFAQECIVKALQAKKNVVTANKDLIATQGPYLFQLALDNGVDIRYEAAVLGGIPIIRPLYDSLGGNQIKEMMGIMNGTTNYMLSKMTDEGLDYADVLKEAQELGYAEADPTADVGGLDAARKLAILASIAFNQRIFFEDVTVEGITKIEKRDIEQAARMGYVIKLVGIAKEIGQGLALSVRPVLLPKTHPMASVSGAYNAIFVRGDGIGDAMFYGQGAGALPTGSSVVSDIMDIAKHVSDHATGRMLHFYKSNKFIYPAGKVQSPYYLRIHANNKIGVLSRISGKLSDNKISVSSFVQEELGDGTVFMTLVTAPCARANMEQAIFEIGKLHNVLGVKNCLSVLGI